MQFTIDLLEEFLFSKQVLPSWTDFLLTWLFPPHVHWTSLQIPKGVCCATFTKSSVIFPTSFCFPNKNWIFCKTLLALKRNPKCRWNFTFFRNLHSELDSKFVCFRFAHSQNNIKMADSASELESDTSSIDGGPTLKTTSPGNHEQLQKRIESLMQENRVLKMELETYKLKCKQLQEENRELRRASVTIVSEEVQMLCLQFIITFWLFLFVFIVCAFVL